MKEFFKTNKNNIFLCTYVILLAVIALNWSTVADIFFTIIGLLTPLFLSIAIAFVLNIPMRRIENGLKKVVKENHFLYRFLRTISILLTLIFAAFILYLLFIIIVPRVSESLQLVFNNFGNLLNNIIDSANGIFKELNMDFRLQDIRAIKDLQGMSWNDIFNQAIAILGGFADGVLSNAVAFTNTFLEWFLAFCLSLYFLAGKETFVEQIRKVILAFFSLKQSDWLFTVGTHANVVFTKFVGGQLVDCAIKGVMFYVLLLVIDYPLPELCAAIITVCSIVPVFGPIFAMCIDFVLIFAFNPMQALIFIVLFQVFSNLEAQIIYPRIVGKSIGLPGVWVLLSIFVLGDVWGIAGMVLAVPLTALAYALFTDFVEGRLRRKDKAFVSGDMKWEGAKDQCDES